MSFYSEASCNNRGKRTFPREQRCSLLPLQQLSCFGLSIGQNILVRERQKDLLRNNSENSEDIQVRNRDNINRDRKPKMRHLVPWPKTRISTRIFGGADHLYLPAVHGLNRISHFLSCGPVILVGARHSYICCTDCLPLPEASQQCRAAMLMQSWVPANEYSGLHSNTPA